MAVHLFYFMDRQWYHRLLVGSVKKAIYIEEKYADLMPEMGLSAAIGSESPVKMESKFWIVIIGWLVRDKRFKETGCLHSDAKIDLFYRSVSSLLWFLFFCMFLFGGVRVGSSSMADAILHFLEKTAACLGG